MASALSWSWVSVSCMDVACGVWFVLVIFQNFFLACP